MGSVSISSIDIHCIGVNTHDTQWPYFNGSQATTSDNTDVDHRVWTIDAWRAIFPIQFPSSYWRSSWRNIWESNRRKRTFGSAQFECLYYKSRFKGADWTFYRRSKYSIDKAESDGYHPSRGRTVGISTRCKVCLMLRQLSGQRSSFNLHTSREIKAVIALLIKRWN